MEDISIRLLVVVLIFATIIFIKFISRISERKWTKSKKVNRDLLPLWQPGSQSIMFFTNDSCFECDKLQKPALKLLQTKNTQIFTINASLETALANYYRILTVPTTIILNNQGLPQFINHGYTNEKILSAQLDQIKTDQ